MTLTTSTDRQNVSKFPRIFAISLATGLLLTGCGKTVVDTACLSFLPIPYHGKADSPDTIERIRAHNAAWRSLCVQ